MRLIAIKLLTVEATIMALKLLRAVMMIRRMLKRMRCLMTIMVIISQRQGNLSEGDGKTGNNSDDAGDAAMLLVVVVIRT